MDTRETVALRIRQLCAERKITPNGLANLSAVPQATIKSILNDESKNPGVVTIKKLCDGLDITLGEFFSTPEFRYAGTGNQMKPLSQPLPPALLRFSRRVHA